MGTREEGVSTHAHCKTHVTASRLTHTNTIQLPFSLSQHVCPIAGVLAPEEIECIAVECWPSHFACTAEKTCAPVHCEDSQLLKHHSCTAAEDAAGKVPHYWIPSLPQKPQTLHIMPATERKRREERRQDQPGWGMDAKMRK